jgi:hypothetical protein
VEIKNYVNHKPVVSISSPSNNALVMDNITIEWTATDQNTEDILTISIFHSKDTKTWEPIEEGIANMGSTIWDTASVEDGSYYIKVVASDGNGNDGSKVVGPIVIENVQEIKDIEPVSGGEEVDEQGSNSIILITVISILILILLAIIVIALLMMIKLNKKDQAPLPTVPIKDAPYKSVLSGSTKRDPFGESTIDDLFK